MQNREELGQKGHDGSQKTMCHERGKKYHFQKEEWINIVFGPKYRPLCKYVPIYIPAAISNFLFFLCRLKINRKMQLNLVTNSPTSSLPFTSYIYPFSFPLLLLPLKHWKIRDGWTHLPFINSSVFIDSHFLSTREWC